MCQHFYLQAFKFQSTLHGSVTSLQYLTLPQEHKVEKELRLNGTWILQGGHDGGKEEWKEWACIR